jgi:hypothetical protein
MPLASMNNTGMDSALTRSAMRGANAQNFNAIVNGRMMRPPLGKIFIHSVAKRPFVVSHPLFKHLQLAGCEQGERYVTCTSIPDPVPQACPDQERGGTRVDDNDGWMVAIDVLNPGNFTFDPYNGSGNPDFFSNKNGTNLIAEGVWPSANEKPTEEEIRKAENARDNHYRYLTREAQKRAAKSTKDLNEFIDRYPDVHLAMDQLGLQANWHTANVVTYTCPHCGDGIKQGLAFHKSSADVLCIIDPEGAYKAGAINRERYEEITGKLLPGRRAEKASAAAASE